MYYFCRCTTKTQEGQLCLSPSTLALLLVLSAAETTTFNGPVTIINGGTGKAGRSLIVRERRSWIGSRLLMAYLNNLRLLKNLTRRVEDLENRPASIAVNCNHQCTPCTCDECATNKVGTLWRVLLGAVGALVGLGLALSEAFIRTDGVVFNRFGASFYEVTDQPFLFLWCLAAMVIVGHVGYAIGKQIDKLIHKQEN